MRQITIDEDVELTPKIKEELAGLCNLSSLTFARKFKLSNETGYYLIRLLDNHPDIKRYLNSIAEIRYIKSTL